MPVRLHTYEADPPSNDIIRDAFLNDTDYTYVVAPRRRSGCGGARPHLTSGHP